MIPSIAAAELINRSQHLERAFLLARDEHARSVRLGTMRTLIGIFCCRAIEAGRNEIYLFQEYRLA